MPNRLANETSPYLLQHAENPVDWYPWGEEALERAREEDKPILLSIGYSACHWCHVMERESFEDEDTAAFMNEHFVNIKVDREERPDLDEIYMAATVAMNHGRGGWPMTVFLTPDQQPFFAGTYFPPTDRHGMPGFPTVLQRMAEVWENQRDMVVEDSKQVREIIDQQAQPKSAGAVGETELQRAVGVLARSFDPEFGGFSPAPKFPPSTALDLLLRHHHRTGDDKVLRMVTRTLDAMADGGMHDHIGGGFARYSTDERWLVPHFEKMLYDNAQLARAYLHGWQVTRDERYARVARGIFEFVLREMTDEGGGFYSALDADSEGVEGKFYVWRPSQVEAVLGEDAPAFCEHFNITEPGNWEGVSIPNTIGGERRTPDELAPWIEKIYEARAQRVWPGLDDKVLTSWNGLMIGALAEGARVLHEPRYLDAARRAVDFIRDQLTTDAGRLLRTWRKGQAHLQAYLEDYAYLADALVDLYEAGGDTAHLHWAAELADVIENDYSSDDNDAFCTTARDHEALIVRRQEGHDGAIPNANAVAAGVLSRLSFHFDRPAWRERAIGAIQAHSAAIQAQPRGFASTLAVVDLLLEGPIEIAVIGEEPPAHGGELWQVVSSRYLPNRILATHDPSAGAVPDDLPLLAGREAIDGEATLYICRNFVCEAPVVTATKATERLDAATREAQSARKSAAVVQTPGHATPGATGRYANRFENLAPGYTTFPKLDWTVSRVGFGGYRVDDRNADHRVALRKALTHGCNLIDTSTNYTDGASERMIGDELRGLAETVSREAVVVVSKIGYLQGENQALAHRREAEGNPFPEVVKYTQAVWHCIHPEFLRDQLERSLGRLQLETLDVLLLHNPEYFLTDAHKRGQDLESARNTFYARIEKAFACMEELVAEGKICAYGVSSNTVAQDDDDPEATRLSRFLEAAHAAGGNTNHFRVLQLPLNLIESEGQDVIEQAAEAGLAVLVNRPLNAITANELTRLADYPQTPGADDLSFEDALAQVKDLEDEFMQQIGAQLQTGEGSMTPEEFFPWGRELDGVLGQLGTREQWHQIMEHQIGRRLGEVMHALDHHLTGDVAQTWRQWRERYMPVLDALFASIDRALTRVSQERSDRVTKAIDPAIPETRRSESLSRKALWTLTSTPGVTTVLLGMRRARYVDDALAVMEWPAMDDPQAVYRAARNGE